MIPRSGPLIVAVDKDGTLDPKRAERDEARVPPEVVQDLICEEKRSRGILVGFAAHWRVARFLEEGVKGAFHEAWKVFSDRALFQVQRGDHVIEIKPPIGKGRAIEELLGGVSGTPSCDG